MPLLVLQGPEGPEFQPTCDFCNRSGPSSPSRDTALTVFENISEMDTPIFLCDSCGNQERPPEKVAGPWEHFGDRPDFVRYPKTDDGRIWSNGDPRWLAIVAPCCQGRHFTWYLGDGDDNWQHAFGYADTADKAKAEADLALKQRHWYLV